MKTAFLGCLLFIAGLFPGDGHGDDLVFSSNTVMDLTLPVDFKSLCHPRQDEDCDFIKSILEYSASDGTTESIPVEVKIRGGWRSLAKNCSAPLLWIRFDEQQVAGTPFEGQSLLPLTTHCGRGLSLENAMARDRRATWEQYLLREYLGHQLYQVLTEQSIRTRLVRISYPNPGQFSRTILNYAFFSEHFDAVAARNGAERLPRGSFNHELLDTHSADVLALYQFMIGNTDWSIARERNTILIQTPEGKQVPVPYDLDMSGLVNAHYAGPAPTLPIDSVRDRYYLGYCHPDLDWEALFDEFRQQQQSILQTLDNIPGLDKNSVRSTRRFLDKFFDLLNSEDRRNKYIVNACKAWPPSPVDHTTPASKL